MSGNSLLVDTNILLYLLSGDQAVTKLLNGKRLYISFITELELLGFAGLKDGELLVIEELIDDVRICDINTEIKKETVRLKRSMKMKLPDAIIAATSNCMELPLLTADKDFKKAEISNLIFYDAAK